MKQLNGLIDSQQLEKDVLEEIFSTADEMKIMVSQETQLKEEIRKAKNIEEALQIKKSNSRHPYTNLLSGMILGNIFYEKSTRTSWSFKIAMLLLGGMCVNTDDAKTFSSVAKGESLEDTIRVLSGYPLDVITLRYDKVGGAKRAQAFSSKPVINAGDGKGQHPTQALLDIYTMIEVFGEPTNLNILIMGDLDNGRTVRSLAYNIGKHYPKNVIHFGSPEKVKIGDDIKEFLSRHNVEWHEHFKLTPDLIRSAQVVYQTRIQKERFEDNLTLFREVEAESELFIVDEDFLEQMDENGIIMHPLPRVNEITYAVDNDSRAHYFQQALNGIYVRMALLKMILIGY
jgi:aspartate carbamoyltransferase catalytic subunit